MEAKAAVLLAMLLEEETAAMDAKEADDYEEEMDDILEAAEDEEEVARDRDDWVSSLVEALLRRVSAPEGSSRSTRALPCEPGLMRGDHKHFSRPGKTF